MKRFLLTAVFAGTLPAADTRVAPPVLGYMFDPQAGGARAIEGIPGASRFSEVLDLNAFKTMWVAPGKPYALAAGVDGQAYRVHLHTNAVLAVSHNAPHRVVWSSGGGAALLLYADGRLKTLRSVAGAPETAIETSVATGVTMLAVSDDAELVLAVDKTDHGTDLIAIGPAGNRRQLLSAPGLSMAAFLHGTHDAVVADSVEGKIYLLRGGTELSLASRQSEPSAIAVATDNSRVYVASKALRIVSTIRLSDGYATSAECSCGPDVLDALEGGVFRVTSLTDGPVWLFRGGEAINPFTFVPSPAVHVE